MKCFLSFMNISIRLESDDPVTESVMSRIIEEFAFMKATDHIVEPCIELRIKNEAYFPPDGLLKRFTTRTCTVYDLERTRYCRYSSTEWLVERNIGPTRVASIYSADPNLLFEIAYTYVLSSLGEDLDLQGVHRLHALGLEQNGIGTLILLPSRGGKSTMAQLLLSESQISLLGDEMPLLKGQRLAPFPLRLAFDASTVERLGLNPDHMKCFKRRVFAPKWTLPIPQDRIGKTAQLRYLLFLSRWNTKDGKIRPASRIQGAWRLFLFLVIGWGLPQMREHMIRPGNWGRLFRILLNRAIQTFYCLRTLEFFAVPLSGDHQVTARAIIDFVCAKHGVTLQTPTSLQNARQNARPVSSLSGSNQNNLGLPNTNRRAKDWDVPTEV